MDYDFQTCHLSLRKQIASLPEGEGRSASEEALHILGENPTVHSLLDALVYIQQYEENHDDRSFPFYKDWEELHDLIQE